MRRINEIVGDMDEDKFLMKAYMSFRFFVERVLGLDVKDFHVEWIDMIEKNDRVAVVAPTGHGKTEILGVAYPLWLATFRENQWILIVTNITSNAIKILERIKEKIKTNEFLQKLIPDDRKSTWSKTEIQTSTNCRFFVRACTYNVRSLPVHLVIADEVSGFDKDVWKTAISTRVMSVKGKIVAISTPETETDLIMELTDQDISPTYIGKRYKACKLDETGEIIEESVLWPERFSKEYLEQIREEIGDHAFSQQYLCDPVPSGSSVVSRDDLMEAFDDSRILLNRPSKSKTYRIGIDFAISQLRPRAATVAVVVTEEDGKAVITDARRMKGMGIEAQEVALENLYKRWSPTKMNVDASTFGQGFVHDLKKLGMPIYGYTFSAETRMKLLTNLARMFGQRNIVIPHNFTDQRTSNLMGQMIKEIDHMGWAETPGGAPTIKSYGKTDDMVMALALAVYDFRKSEEFVTHIRTG